MRILFLVIILCSSCLSFAQKDEITLTNPSFEGSPGRGAMSGSLIGWFDCGIINFPNESPPDVHPGGHWGVDSESFHGETYLGLVVRDNNTWESVSQRLSLPLQPGNCYTMSMAVAQSEKYLSGSRLQSLKGDLAQRYNYSTPVIIRIYGGTGYCNSRELLATSSIVNNFDWEILDLEFIPDNEINYITIEAYYQTPNETPYNGHVLIDDLSTILQIECLD